MLRTKKKLLISSIILASSLTGCTTIPDSSDVRTINRDDVNSKVKSKEGWSQDPAIKTVYSKTGTQIIKKSEIPDALKNTEISIKARHNTNIEDFLAALSLELDIPTITGSQEVAEQKVYIPKYDGKLINLLDMISSSKDISFDYKDGYIVARKDSSYIITLPQDNDLLQTISTELSNIGARNVQSSVSSGSIFYNTTLKNQEKIETYLDRIISNSSLITLQVMVINVNTDRDRKSGFDWSNFQSKIGDIGQVGASSKSNDNSFGGNSNEDDVRGSGLIDGELVSLTGSALGINLARGSIDISGLFNVLSTYGNTKTNQDVSLKTISGKEVQLDSFQEIPYVSDVDLSTTSDGLSNSGLETDTVKNGLTMKFLPYYDAESRLVSIDVNIELETLLGFVELSGGNQLGTITQPRTQRQAFNNKIRTPVGESVILGGVTYESISDNRSNLSFLEKHKTANKNEDISSNSLFIIIRPTVVLYKNIGKEVDKNG